MDIGSLKRRCREEFCIPVEEDYGYREWIWFPPVPRDEIEAFWAAQGAFDWQPDQCLPGEWIGGIDDDDNGDFYDIYYSLWRSPEHYAVHFDGQLSTALLTPDGRAVFHSAFDEQEGTFPRDEIANWAKRRVDTHDGE